MQNLTICVALAGVNCLRFLAGFGFPLFAPYMYDSLGYGKGDTILAAFVLGVCLPAYVFSHDHFSIIHLSFDISLVCSFSTSTAVA